ncbi:MAG TPA: ABC transporter permease [Dehalococcoidia bacterium]
MQFDDRTVTVAEGLRGRAALPGSGALAFLGRLLRVRMAGFALAVVLITVIMALFARWLAPHDPTFTGPEPLASPSLEHPLGTDQLGRDMLSQIIYGSRIALAVSTGAVLLGTVVGGSLGILSGYVRGILDEVTMRAMDALVAFPGLILALALASALRPSLQTVIIAIAVANVPWIARVARSQALGVREMEYVTAARALGAGPGRILTRYILPNSLAPIIVQSTLGMGYAVLAAAGLSFLGAGVPPPTPDWGAMVRSSYGLLAGYPLLALAPGAAIFLLVLSFNLLGDALRDVLDPRLRGAQG